MKSYYMVIAAVNVTYYLTKIEAESLFAAEHAILDLGVCGKHTYGVTACTAYSAVEMKTDAFIGHALSAHPVSFDELKEIIKKRNAEILEKDAAEERISVIEKQMKKLQKELEEAKATFAK